MSKTRLQGHSKIPSRRSASEQKTTQAGVEAPQSLHCANCGGEHSRNTCRFRNVKCRKCNKLGNIAKVCRSSTAAMMCNQQPELAVVTVSRTDEEKLFHQLIRLCIYLSDMDKHPQLIVYTASPLTFINHKTLQDLKQPKLEPTYVLLQYWGQPIKPIGYFQTCVQRADDKEQFADLTTYVSHCGINLIGCDGQVKLHILASLYLLPITRYLPTYKK